MRKINVCPLRLNSDDTVWIRKVPVSKFSWRPWENATIYHVLFNAKTQRVLWMKQRCYFYISLHRRIRLESDVIRLGKIVLPISSRAIVGYARILDQWLCNRLHSGRRLSFESRRPETRTVWWLVCILATPSLPRCEMRIAPRFIFCLARLLTSTFIPTIDSRYSKSRLRSRDTGYAFYCYRGSLLTFSSISFLRAPVLTSWSLCII